MASEVRVNKIQSQSGLGTMTLTDGGPEFTGITTITTGNVDGNCLYLKNEEVGLYFGNWGTGSTYPRTSTINATRTDSSTPLPVLRVAGQGGLEFASDLNTVRMSIDSSGRVTLPYQPGFFATGTASAANQPGSGEGDDLGPRFNDVAHSGGFNTGNHYNTTTGVFTAPVTGKYYTFFQMRWETANFVQNNYIRIYISRNNSQTLHIHQINGQNEAWNSYMAMSCSGVISLAAGDTLRPKGGMNGGVAVGWWNESSWGAWLLG